MSYLAICIGSVLSVVTIMHALWGLGAWWPVSDEYELARTVVGAPGIQNMPSQAACFLVAAALLTTVSLSLLMGRIVSISWLPSWMIALGGFGAASVFLARGVFGYFPYWSRLTPEEPFRTYDFWFYSPLCMALGFGLFVLFSSFIRSAS